MNENPQKTSGEAGAINVSGVCKSFSGRAVLEGINFRLTRGQGLGICGPNATGKTTLLKIAAGLMQPDEGVVEICGLDLQTETPEIKLMIGAIFHESMVYPQLTVAENLLFFARLYNIENSKGRIEKLLEETGLASCQHDAAGILSRGMTQRLAIARALVHNPVVLLADEPFTGLDSQASKYLVEILRNFKDGGGTIVMTTHNANLSIQCCEQVAVLDERKLIFSAAVSEIDTSEFAQDYLSYARKKR